MLEERPEEQKRKEVDITENSICMTKNKKCATFNCTAWLTYLPNIQLTWRWSSSFMFVCFSQLAGNKSHLSQLDVNILIMLTPGGTIWCLTLNTTLSCVDMVCNHIVEDVYLVLIVYLGDVWGLLFGCAVSPSAPALFPVLMMRTPWFDSHIINA